MYFLGSQRSLCPWWLLCFGSGCLTHQHCAPEPLLRETMRREELFHSRIPVIWTRVTYPEAREPTVMLLSVPFIILVSSLQTVVLDQGRAIFPTTSLDTENMISPVTGLTAALSPSDWEKVLHCLWSKTKLFSHSLSVLQSQTSIICGLGHTRMDIQRTGMLWISM